MNELHDLFPWQSHVPNVAIINHASELKRAAQCGSRLDGEFGGGAPGADLPSAFSSPYAIQWTISFAHKLSVQMHVLISIVPRKSQVVPALGPQIEHYRTRERLND